MNELRAAAQNAINTFLHNPNQFASGGLFLMAVGAIGALLRKIPNQIWDWIVFQTTVTLTVTDDQKAFIWTKVWFENQRIMKRTRHLDVFNRGSEQYIILPSPGHHWMLYKNRILSVTFDRTSEKKLGQTTRNETLTFKTIGRSQKLFRDMMKEIHAQFVKKEEKKPELYSWGRWDEWDEVHAFSPRSLDSVILPEEQKQLILRDLDDFKASGEWYGKMGIPYRKGYLFYGPPGTGKTSLVSGLASHYNSNVYMLKLADMSDTTLRNAVRQVEPNSFLIIEDIDGISASHSRKIKTTKKEDSKNGVTLSGLLNVIDGMLSPSGAIFILTTNHIEKLDPALLRPGRTDIKLCLTYATESQKKELYSRFFKDECPSKYLNKKMTLAELQQFLMEKKQQEAI